MVIISHTRRGLARWTGEPKSVRFDAVVLIGIPFSSRSAYRAKHGMWYRSHPRFIQP
jgi:hypothetical protein